MVVKRGAFPKYLQLLVLIATTIRKNNVINHYNTSSEYNLNLKVNFHIEYKISKQVIKLKTILHHTFFLFLYIQKTVIYIIYLSKIKYVILYLQSVIFCISFAAVIRNVRWWETLYNQNFFGQKPRNSNFFIVYKLK